jgi:hypothetical protein
VLISLKKGHGATRGTNFKITREGKAIASAKAVIVDEDWVVGKIFAKESETMEGDEVSISR